MQFDDFEAEALLNGNDTQSSSPEEHSHIAKLPAETITRAHLAGMYKDWFLDYASYVILERAVPT